MFNCQSLLRFCHKLIRFEYLNWCKKKPFNSLKKRKEKDKIYEHGVKKNIIIYISLGSWHLAFYVYP
jgi:hypothetical protein